MMTNETTPVTTFGELLRCWRRKQGLSQGGFGELLAPKARHSTVSCWESGARAPSRKYLGQIVAITGIPALLVLGSPGGSPAEVGP